MPAMVKRVQTTAEFLVEPGKLDRTRLVMLFKQPERFPDHFACGVVAARFHFGAHEFLKLGSKRNMNNNAGQGALWDVSTVNRQVKVVTGGSCQSGIEEILTPEH